MAKLTIAMNQAYLSEEEVIRVTNEEFVTVRRDDLMGDFDLRIDVSTPEKDEDTANKLNMLLQTNAASMDPAEARIIASYSSLSSFASRVFTLPRRSNIFKSGRYSRICV